MTRALLLLLCLSMGGLVYGLGWRNYSWEAKRSEFNYMFSQVREDVILHPMFLKYTGKTVKQHLWDLKINFMFEEASPFRSDEDLWETRIDYGMESKKWWWF